MAAAVALAFVAGGCDGVFDYHPYDVRFGGQTGINATAIGRIGALCGGKDTLRVAFVSDSHGWYTCLRPATWLTTSTAGAGPTSWSTWAT